MRWPLIVLPPVVVGLLFALVPLFATQAGPRVALMASLLGVCCLVNLRDGWQAEQREPLRLRRIALFAIALTLVFTLVRGTLNVTLVMPANFMAPDAVQPVMMVVGLALLMFWNLSVMLMPSERQRNQLLRAAQDDALTNLLNRGGFLNLASRQLTRARQSGQPCCVLLMDLDHFKRVNDTHGHEAGDRLLYAFAEAVREQSRPTDLVARYGGEEFTALLPQAELATACAVAERIRQQLETAAVPVAGGSLSTTVSIGVAQLQGDETLPAAMQRADAALYRAKHEGRNRVVAAAPHG